MHEAANLSRNLRRLRSDSGYTQARLAEVCGVPRPTIAKIESGSPNPTLSVLSRIARGLRVSIEELIAPPPSLGRKYRPDELPSRKHRGVEVRQLIPQALPGITLERMEFRAGARLSGAPHPAGSMEYLAVESGTVHLTTPEARWEVGPGEVVSYRGDQTHGYHNPNSTPAVGYTLIVPRGRSADH